MSVVYNKSKNVLINLLLILIICLFNSCINEWDEISGKWQLRSCESKVEGMSMHVDSVFYNFQKGSFSQLCILEDGNWDAFYGNYTLKADEISVILLPDNLLKENYAKYVGWDDGKIAFDIVTLTSKQLVLQSESLIMRFRKY